MFLVTNPQHCQKFMSFFAVFIKKTKIPGFFVETKYHFHNYKAWNIAN